MTTYPGEDPQKPEQDPAVPNEVEPGTEPTQPVGYWERQAAEQAGEPRAQDPYTSPSGAEFNPTSGQPGPPPTRPYEAGPYGQPAHGQPSYGQPYPQPGSGYPPPGGQPVPPPPAPGHVPYAGFAAPRPDHPQANLSMILGIVGLVAGFTCGLGFVISPFAWGIGRNALKEIAASQGRMGGEGPAKAGMITGIVGTVFLALGVLALVIFAALLVVGASTSGTSA